MSYPTTLGPWFVVQRLTYGDDEQHGTITGIEYYQSSAEGDESWTTDKRYALLFMGLNQAARIADAESAHVRALSSKAEAEEFGRG